MAYQHEDMSVWKGYIDSTSLLHSFTPSLLIYEYGYCGYIVAEAKKEGKDALLPEAKHYVQQFNTHVEALRGSLHEGHYEMYKSAVYVYELRLKQSIHPLKAMNLAKEATQLAPDDPLTLSYYGTCLFYAPQPFGSKKEALQWFEKAETLFRHPKWQDCWIKDATHMYIRQCKEKINASK